MVPPDSRAILIGVSRYDDTESFPGLLAAANSLRAMRVLLADPELCGWLPEQIITVPNPASRAEVEELLSDTAERTTGVLLIYYVGHGVLSPKNELCLTVTSTRPTRPKITGLPWESVSEILDVRNCPAQTRIAILDCCYAGQVISESLGASTAVADATATEGAYTLTATIRNRTAHVVPADQQELARTSFTGELCDLVREGVTGRGEWLMLGELYPLLRDRLRAKGLPQPNQRGTDTADRFPFTANRALLTPATARRIAASAVLSPPSAVVQPGRDTTLLRQAALDCFDAVVSYAYGTRDYSEEVTQGRLRNIAEYAAVAEPDRAERIARRLPGHDSKVQVLTGQQDPRMRALTGVALTMATWATTEGRDDTARAADLLNRARRMADELTAALQTTPLWRMYGQVEVPTGGAERLLRSLAEGYPWAGQIWLVMALVAREPDDAARCFDRALQASRFLDRYWKGVVQSGVAKAVMMTDPERAFGIAENIRDKQARSITFQEMAQIVARDDRDQAVRMLAEAERTAGKISDKLSKDNKFAKIICLSKLAEALAPLDAPWAERVANSINHPNLRQAALYVVASAVARKDAARAERIGRGLPNDADKASILAIVARLSADPNRTAGLLAEAEGYLRPLEPDSRKAAAIMEIARTLSAFDPGRSAALCDEVETILGNLADTGSMHLLLRIVQSTAEIDPDRAALLLKGICTMTLSPESHAINDMGRGMALENIAKHCMKIISS